MRGKRAGGLSARIPNPPATLVGRDAERSLLHEALRRGPVTVVAGPGGVGKSALASAVLLDPREAEEGHARAVAARPRDSLSVVQTAVLRVLDALESPGSDWATTSEDGLAERTIEEIEGRSATVLIEDAHHLPASSFDDWLARLARFLRTGRVVITSRRLPALPEIAEQLVVVPPLGESAAAVLFRACNPALSEAEIKPLVARAAGLPLRIRQLALKEHATNRIDAFVVRAAMIEMPLPRRVLGQLTPEGQMTLEALEASGSLEEGNQGELRLHDVVRDTTLEQLGREERTRTALEVAEVLADGPTVAALEAVRLFAEAGDPRAATVAESRFEAFFSEGYGARLFAIGRDSPCLASTTWRSVLALAGGDALRWALAQPRPEDPRDTLRWLRAQTLGGRHALCRAEAARLAERAPDLAPMARLIEARAALQMGSPREAIQLLMDVDAPSPLGLAHQATLGLAQAAAAFTSEALAAADTLAAADAAEARWAAATIYAAMGRGRRVDEVLDSWDATALNGELLRSRAHLLTHVFRRVERGELDEAEASLERLRRYPPQSTDTWHRHMQRLAEIRLALARGRFEGLDQNIAEVRAEAQAAGEFWSCEWAEMLDTVRRLATHEPCREPTRAPAGAGDSPARSVVEGCRRIAAARKGQRPPAADTLPDFVEARILALRACAIHELSEGATECAIRRLRSARELTIAHALRLQEFAVVRDLGDACLTVDEEGEAECLGRWLEATASAAGAHRYAATGLALKLAARGARCDEWLALARNDTTSPSAARRARAMLGVPMTDEPIEQLVVARARAGRERGVHGDGPWETTWGADLHEGQAWSATTGPTRPITALSARLIRALARGPQTKESLVRECWGQPTYHPNRDDKRLQMAMRRLRNQVEDDPSAASRVVTCPEGYRLGDARFVWLA